MANLQVLQPQQHAQWMNVLERSFQYDFYHLPGYHLLAEQHGDGQAYLFVYTEEPYCIAVPLLLRSVDTVPGLEQCGEGWWDATSVYGYVGPVSSHVHIPESVKQDFRASLSDALQERQIVAIFSRFHPLIFQHKLLSRLGKCVSMGQTISIDLTLHIGEQRSHYRKNHKHGINKLVRLGVTCMHDQSMDCFEEFIDIYYETMRRVHASQYYFFSPTYFRDLMSMLKANAQLFVCLLDGNVICAGLFTLCNNIVQYHLGGTRNDFLKLAPTKLLFDTVRIWANEQKAHSFHLGGGVGSREDSLFQFKAGFSKQRHDFSVWCWVLLPEIYDRLYKEQTEWNNLNKLKPVSAQYFPAYRSQTILTSWGEAL
jgi:hypothetical protein